MSTSSKVAAAIDDLPANEVMRLMTNAVSRDRKMKAADDDDDVLGDHS